jgi:hypothetical protein
MVPQAKTGLIRCECGKVLKYEKAKAARNQGIVTCGYCARMHRID